MDSREHEEETHSQQKLQSPDAWSDEFNSIVQCCPLPDDIQVIIERMNNLNLASLHITEDATFHYLAFQDLNRFLQHFVDKAKIKGNDNKSSYLQVVDYFMQVLIFLTSGKSLVRNRLVESGFTQPLLGVLDVILECHSNEFQVEKTSTHSIDTIKPTAWELLIVLSEGRNAALASALVNHGIVDLVAQDVAQNKCQEKKKLATEHQGGINKFPRGLILLANIAFYSDSEELQQKLNDVIAPRLSEFYSEQHDGCVDFLIQQITVGTTHERLLTVEQLHTWMYGLEAARYSKDKSYFVFRWPPPSDVVTSLTDSLKVIRLSLKTDEQYGMVAHNLQHNHSLLEEILTGKDGEDKTEVQAILQKVCSHQCVYCPGPSVQQLLETESTQQNQDHNLEAAPMSTLHKEVLSQCQEQLIYAMPGAVLNYLFTDDTITEREYRTLRQNKDD